ncbi:MAG: DoxX family membrane protein [Phycisphaerales bacterium]|jgi:uncharacterized membrane protein YphA (DoxX/SURF4 family)|nr:DoxX family membrane protein [Phycisphaerales bacterium]
MSTTLPTRIGFTLLLSRIVLGAALFFSGWHACFQEVEFTPDEIRTLEGVGVVAVPVVLVESADPPAAAPDAATPKPIGPLAAPGTAAADAGSASSDDPSAEGNVRRAAAERMALCLRTHGFGEWSEPTAWAAAVVQLLGGAALLLGLLTRLWAFLIAVILGASFWLGSVESAGMFDRDPFEWAAAGDAFYQMFFVLAMFVLSLWVLLSGPGFLSLDRLFWPRAGATPSAPRSQATEGE